MNPPLKTSYKGCILCDAEAKRVFEGMSGYVEGTKYDVYECQICRSSFVDPMSNLKEEYDLIYGKENRENPVYSYYYYLAKGVRQLRNPLLVLSNYTAIYWGVMKAFRSHHISKDAKILEVGSGLGYFTYALRKSGYNCDGLEYSSTAVSFAEGFFGSYYTQGTIETYGSLHENVYDVIIATEVIEHVADPISFIGTFLQVLKPDGKIILTTPNKDVHPQGTIWETDHAPKHLWWFTENGLNAIAKHFNKEITVIDFAEYKKHNRYTIPKGKAYADPKKLPAVDANGRQISGHSMSFKTRLMRGLPAWIYMYLVCFYHRTVFRLTSPSDGSMYSLCVVIKK